MKTVLKALRRGGALLTTIVKTHKIKILKHF